MKVAKYFSSKPKKTILEDNPKSIDDYDREMLQQFCWDAEHGIEDDEIDETVKLFMEWRNRRAKAYADERNKERDIKLIKFIYEETCQLRETNSEPTDMNVFAKSMLKHFQTLNK